MSGFWFPRFNFDGSRLTHQDENKYQAQFMGAVEIWQNGSNMVFDGAVQPGIKAYNLIAAGNNKWAGWRPDTGIERSFGPPIPIGGVPAISPNGAFFAYVDVLQSNNKTLKLEWDGGAADLAVGSITDIRLSDKACVWANNGTIFGHWFGVKEGRIQVAPREFGPVAFDLPNGEVWVGTYTDTGIIVRPFGEKMGYRFDNGGNTYYPDWIWDKEKSLIHCVFTDARGNFGDKFFDINAPRVDLSNVVNPPDISVPPIGRAIWLSYFEFEVPNPYPPGNSILQVFTGGDIHARSDNRLIAQFVTGSTVEDIEQQCARTSSPCLAYWDARVWPRLPLLKQNDYLGLQTYCGVNETPQQFEENMKSIIRATGEDRIALVCQCYTSNDGLTKRIAELVPVYARLAKEFTSVQMLAIFSDQGRATGLEDHPEVLPLYQELFVGITGEPQEENPNMPEVMPLEAYEVCKEVWKRHKDECIALHPNEPEKQARELTGRMNEQMEFTFPGQGYCWKSTSPGGTPSKDIVARQHNGLFTGWDMYLAAGVNGPRDLNDYPPPAHDLAGQNPIEVPAKNWLEEPQPSDISVLILDYDKVVKRSDPNGMLIRFEAASSLPVKKVELELEGDGEPSIEISFIPENRRDGRYVRALAFKPVVNGSWILVVRAWDINGNSAEARGSQAVTVTF